VAWGGIEPPTQGFSVPPSICFSVLIGDDEININQQITSIPLLEFTATVLIGIDQNSAKLATLWLHRPD
jgi:hypothetical protein